MEPELNSSVPGDARDTTTPAAMLGDLEQLLIGTTLSSASRSRLESWLTQNTTGGAMIRAGVPAKWRVGDKTGQGANGSTNDIAIIHPPHGSRILLTIYFTESKRTGEERKKVIRDVAGMIVDALTGAQLN